MLGPSGAPLRGLVHRDSGRFANRPAGVRSLGPPSRSRRLERSGDGRRPPGSVQAESPPQCDGVPPSALDESKHGDRAANGHRRCSRDRRRSAGRRSQRPLPVPGARRAPSTGPPDGRRARTRPARGIVEATGTHTEAFRLAARGAEPLSPAAERCSLVRRSGSDRIRPARLQTQRPSDAFCRTLACREPAALEDAAEAWAGSAETAGTLPIGHGRRESPGPARPAGERSGLR